jgi:tetratricopeptide (TPR) repeat protein
MLLKEGKFKEAKEAFEKAIIVNSQDAWAQCGLGTACGLLILYNEGIEYASRGVKKLKDEYTYAALGFAYEEKGEYLKAIEQYKLSIAKKSDYVVAHYNIGRDYLILGWYDEAIAEFKETLKVLPDFAEAHNNLGSAYWYKGQIVEAEFEFKAALSSTQDVAEAHYNLGILYEVQEKYSKASAHYRKVLALVPDLKVAKKRLERVEANVR